jgi:predicted ATPase
MQIKMLDFFDYKSFTRFTINARTKNILVGANNAGKSTSLDALRIVFDALRYARRHTSKLKSQGNYGVCATYFVPQSVIQTDIRYCVHNFDDKDAKIEILLSNGNKFVMVLNPDADIECYLVSEVPAQKGAQYLRSQFDAEIIIVPTLSPLEQNEELVQLETVERNRFGRLSSRNFRNYWLHKTTEEFEVFANLVEYGWPGIRVRKPEIEHGDRNFVRMYFRDGRNVREVQWAGFGFQVWMQTMMHLTQASEKSILVLDEPDIYLHPDLQHRLLKLVSQRVGQFFIATHSTEIINAADPGDVLIVRPSARSAKRIRSDENYPEIYSVIGSSENAQFARLARTRKVLYFEGLDNKLLSKISKSVRGIDFISGSSVTLMRTDGFSNWGRVSTTAWVFKEFFEIDVQVAALFDRDYRSDGEVEEFEISMAEKGAFCFVLPFKELENALLSCRAIKEIVRKNSSVPIRDSDIDFIDQLFQKVIENSRDEVFGQRMGHYIQFVLKKNPKMDTPTISSAFQKRFSQEWLDDDFRRAVVPGKKVFSEIVKLIQDKFGVTVTPARVSDELILAEIHPKLLKILAEFKNYFGSGE